MYVCVLCGVVQCMHCIQYNNSVYYVTSKWYNTLHSGYHSVHKTKGEGGAYACTVVVTPTSVAIMIHHIVWGMPWLPVYQHTHQLIHILCLGKRCYCLCTRYYTGRGWGTNKQNKKKDKGYATSLLLHS